MKIQLINPHFLDEGKTWEGDDLCLHGTTFMEIAAYRLEYSGTVSAAALMLLRTIFQDHTRESRVGEHMLPCCGSMLFPQDDGRCVMISGCCNGVDFEVIHRGEEVLFRMQDGSEHWVSLSEYRNAVIAYAKQVDDYYHTKIPRNPKSMELEEGGYDAFQTEFHALLTRAEAEK